LTLKPISEAIKIVKTNGRAIVVGITHTNVTVPINLLKLLGRDKDHWE